MKNILLIFALSSLSVAAVVREPKAILLCYNGGNLLLSDFQAAIYTGSDEQRVDYLIKLTKDKGGGVSEVEKYPAEGELTDFTGTLLFQEGKFEVRRVAAAVTIIARLQYKALTDFDLKCTEL
jgi:hypothetical protein